jgi:hypothetical protein
LRKIFASLLVCFILIISTIGISPTGILFPHNNNLLWSDASSPPVSNCLPFAITTPETLTGVQCIETKGIVVSGTGSITLNNSTLILNGGGTFGDINLTQTAKLILDSSSTIANSTINMADQSSLTSSGNSLLNLTGFQATGVPTISLSSTTLIDNIRSVNLSASTIDISDSELSFVTSRALVFEASAVSVSNSRIVSSNSTSTTLDGVATLTIANSYLSSNINSSVANSPGSEAIYLNGGNISVDSSSLVSSGITPFGFPPINHAILNITSSGIVNISSSNLDAGETVFPGSFNSAQLYVNSLGGNLTIDSTNLQSISRSSSLYLSANIHPTSSVVLTRSLLEMRNSTGLIRLAASNTVKLDHTKLDGPGSTLNVFAQSLWSSGSTIVDSNITRDLTFGFGLDSGTFYNTTLSQCAPLSQTCLAIAQQGGSYSVYDFLSVHVVSSSIISQPLSGVRVNAFDTRTGRIAYTATTNGTGWAEVQVLVVQATFNNLLLTSSYVVQATSQGIASQQLLVPANQSSPVELSLNSGGVTKSLIGAHISNQSEAAISSTFGLSTYTYEYSPPNLYKLGTYIGFPYQPNITIMSNAVPLNYKNNASASEIDFSTVGPNGNTFYFVVIYPKNFTDGPLRLRVDGVYQNSNEVESNSTHYFSIFSIPSGIHKVALVFSLSNGNFSAPIGFPSANPTLEVIVAVLVIALVGIAFLVAYWRRRGEKRLGITEDNISQGRRREEQEEPSSFSPVDNK